MAKALPLQIHPDKEKYSDENHKPEITVAFATFELFVGFKSLNEIQALLQLPSLRHFNNEILKGICRTMPTASESTVRNVTKDLLKVP
jgi:mannose-6-phosphate isomerase